MTFLHADGSLVLAQWAQEHGGSADHYLHVPTGRRTHPMYGSPATGDKLVSNGKLGVDLIRVPAGGGFAPHTHPGDHLLIVIAGEGTITYEGRIYPTRAGQVYMIEGEVAHAVGAVTDHCILAVGSPHRPVDSADRMTLTDYAAVTAEFGSLSCLQCELTGTPAELEGMGCPHVPPKPGTGRLVVVGVAPAPGCALRPAFAGTRSGARLASLIGVEPDRLTEVVDTVNLFPGYTGEWQRIPARDWHLAGAELAVQLAGRVVLACGTHVARSLGAPADRWGACDLIDTYPGDPYLVLTIPHPSGMSHTWDDPAVAATAQRTMAVARSLAAAGPPTGRWEHRDAVALEAVTVGTFSEG